MDHTRVIQGDAAAAVARVPGSDQPALYRGWMLRPGQYAAMHSELQARGVTLLNTPQQYQNCHYLPDSYPWIEGHSPESVWLPTTGDIDLQSIASLLKRFGNRPLVVKDYVKSQKHYWSEACFIPAASDTVAVERVVRRFLELQGEDLNEGLVLREFLPLKVLGTHPKSKMPLAAEFRTFWLDAKPVLSHRYRGDLTEIDISLPLDELQAIAVRVPSRCFTMDIAFLDNGGWTIVELGDGQVAGLPSTELAPEFFTRVAPVLRGAE